MESVDPRPIAVIVAVVGTLLDDSLEVLDVVEPDPPHATSADLATLHLPCFEQRTNPDAARIEFFGDLVNGQEAVLLRWLVGHAVPGRTIPSARNL
jgi:hypothetical protein